MILSYPFIGRCKLFLWEKTSAGPHICSRKSKGYALPTNKNFWLQFTDYI